MCLEAVHCQLGTQISVSHGIFAQRHLNFPRKDNVMGSGVVDKPSHYENLGEGQNRKGAISVAAWYIGFHLVHFFSFGTYLLKCGIPLSRISLIEGYMGG